MDKPLKRQLDKYGRDQSLYLRVMYYINGISLIYDEMTRYHYFLQIKKDVIEGRISCSVEEAIRLASFSMQGVYVFSMLYKIIPINMCLNFLTF